MAFVRLIARKVTVLHEGHVMFAGGHDGRGTSNWKAVEVYLGRGAMAAVLQESTAVDALLTVDQSTCATAEP